MPYTFDEAVAASLTAGRDQQDTEDQLRKLSDKLAQAEHVYRMALASEIKRQHDLGVAWTTSEDLARGAMHVAELRSVRDRAKGKLEAASQRSWRHAADRRDISQLILWSRRGR